MAELRVARANRQWRACDSGLAAFHVERAGEAQDGEPKASGGIRDRCVSAGILRR